MWAAGLRRENWRGREVAFPAGVVLIACSLFALAPLAILDDRADLDLLDPDLARWSVFVIGMALLGLIDDTMGGAGGLRAPRGWRGHARAVMHGKFSTGAVKAVGAIGLAAFATTGNREGLHYVVDLFLLLLTTNLFNLIDLRPGRVEKLLVLLLGRGLPRRLDGGAASPARRLHRPGALRRGPDASRAGHAGRHRVLPGRGDRRDLVARRNSVRGAARRARDRRRASRSSGSFGRSLGPSSAFRCCAL